MSQAPTRPSASGIFEALFRWGDQRAKEEDFYTKCLAFLIRQLQEFNSEIAAELLADWIPDAEQLKGRRWELTDHTGSEGIPDLEILSPSIHIRIEAKVSSPIKLKQLKNYRKSLPEHGRLVILSRDSAAGARRLVDAWASWHDVAQALQRAERRLWECQVDDPRAAYLTAVIKDYRAFLRRSSVDIKPVRSLPDTRTLNELAGLLELMRAAWIEAWRGSDKISGSGLQAWEEPGDGEPGWIGWWFGPGNSNNQLSFGFYFDEPTYLVARFHKEMFETVAKALPAKNPTVEWHELRPGVDGRNPGEDVELRARLSEDFDSMPSDRQWEVVRHHVEQMRSIVYRA